MFLRSIIFLLIISLADQAVAQSAGHQFTVHFNVDSWVPATSDSTIQKLLDLCVHPDIDSVLISAHTDSDASESYNRRLSQKRAESVAALLEEGGVKRDMMHLSWSGEEVPMAVNSTDAGRAQNRRVEVIVHMSSAMREVKGFVQDTAGSPVRAKVYLHGAAVEDSTFSDSDGYFSFTTPDSAVLRVDIFAEGYTYLSQMFRNDGSRGMLNFELRAVERNVKIALHEFFFVGNRAILLPQSEPELQRLVRFMELNPTVYISIEGHVNVPNNPPVKKDSPFYDLSVRRAKMVRDHLVENGVNSDRLEYEGFGNWQMVYPNARTAEHQQRNRRVEIRIISAD